MSTPEERLTRIENALNGLVGVQAEHDARIAENAKQIAKTNEQIEKNVQLIEKNAQQIAKNEAAVRDLIVVSRTLIESQQSANTQIEKTAAELNLLVKTVDRLLKDRHKPNGNQ